MSESFAVSVAEGMDFEHELGVSAEAFCARVLSALWQQEGASCVFRCTSRTTKRSPPCMAIGWTIRHLPM
jgi:hypothetical protein